MAGRNPFEEVEELLERMTSDFPAAGSSGLRSVSVDVSETDDEVTVVADLPGYDTDDIDVSITDRNLTIRADREEETEKEGERYHRRERRHREVTRTLRLPAEVDEEAAEATYSNGVLTVTIPKQETEGGHRIEVE